MTTEPIELIKPDWPAPPNVVAFSTTRKGGNSLPPYDELNLGLHVGDDKDSVMQNRDLLPIRGQVKWLNQVHSNAVVNFANNENVLTADAITTDKPSQFCVVMTADCIPLLLCNETGSQVAAVHAGWKGLQKQIIRSAIRAFSSSAHSIMAWIGPCISHSCYEVGDDLIATFQRQYPDACITSCDKNDSVEKTYLDLPGIAKAQLLNNGVQRIFTCDLCTYSNPHLFFSHRYATHHKLGQTGRFATIIGMTPP